MSAYCFLYLQLLDKYLPLYGFECLLPWLLLWGRSIPGTREACKYKYLSAWGAGLAAEFVHGSPVEKPVAERRLCGHGQILSRHCGWNAPEQADSPIPFCPAGSPLPNELASLPAWKNSGRTDCSMPVCFQTNDARPPACQQAVR
jgi:hypothetical protein